MTATNFGNSMPHRSTKPNPQPLDSAATVAGALVKWFRENARDLPWRRTVDPYAIWISEVMLQQTQVKTVLPFWERWMRELPTVDALASLPEARLLKLWEGLGYYSRVRNLQKSAREIVANFQGHFPSDPKLIRELPGIGRYTAGAIASIAFGQPQPLLDGNVVRVLTRLHGIPDNAREKRTTDHLWQLATGLVTAAAMLQPERHQGARLSAGPCSDLNQSLMELGATVCLPTNPGCLLCPIRQHCVAAAQGLTDRIPNLGKRVAATKRRFVAFVARANDRILVRQRPQGVVNAGLWEFPNVEIGPDESITSPMIGFTFESADKPLVTIRHSITRYRITLDVFHATLEDVVPSQQAGEWISKADLHSLAFSSAHAKIRSKIA